MRKDDKKALERYQKKLDFARNAGGVNIYETKEEKAQRIERAKRDYAFMVDYYFPHYASAPTADFQIEWASMVKRNKTFKGFCMWGRGLAKSVHNCILLPFWLWMCGEPVYLVIISTSNDRAVQLLEDLQAEFEANPRIIADFGEQQKAGQWEDDLWITKGGFIGQALGMGQPERGLRIKDQRPTDIVLDDPETKETVKNPSRQDDLADWIDRGVLKTMDGEIRRFIACNNRFAPRMIITVLMERHPKWKVHRVDAYDRVTHKPRWDSKYPDDYYKQIEEEDGKLAALAEYNNEPHVEGKIFTDEQIQWGKMPHMNHFKIIVGHWDVAYAGTPTSDYNAVRIWGLKDKDFWYITSFVKQSKMYDAVAFMCDYQKNLPSSVIIHWRIESQFWNDELERTIKEVSSHFGINLNYSMVDTPRTRKYDRILTLQPMYQNGRIYYNEKMKPHNDTQVGLAQLKGIEPKYSTHDDAPDADQQAIEFLQKHIPMGSGTGNYRSGKMNPKYERI